MLFIHFIARIVVKVFSFFDLNSITQFDNNKIELDSLIKNNKSLIRWGDGESKILLGGNLYFQKNSAKLFADFIKICANQNSSIEFAVPISFIACTKNELIKSGKYRTWLNTRFILKMIFSKSSKYLDSFVFREDSPIPNSQIFKLWEKESVIFFVHNNYKYFIDFKNKFPQKKVYFIEVTSSNSYRLKNKVIKKIYSIIENEKIDLNDCCSLISSGPFGKVLVFELAKLGLRSLDMGHFFDYKFYEIKRGK